MPICLIVGFPIPPLLSEILQEFQFGIRLSFQGIRFPGLPSFSLFFFFFLSFFPFPFCLSFSRMPAKSLTAEAMQHGTQPPARYGYNKMSPGSPKTGGPFQINVHCISSAAELQTQRGTTSAKATTPENVPIKVLLNTPVMPSLPCEDVWTFFQLPPIPTTWI